ncbi:hypothetical protein, partial [Neisseria montereyensis]
PATVPAAKKPNYTDSKTSSQYPITQKYPTYHHYFVYLENFLKEVLQPAVNQNKHPTKMPFYHIVCTTKR